jgi:hypothetical protein
MAWPDTLLTTYLPGRPPVIKSSDLNAMQLEQVRTWRALRGNDFLLFDDFVSSTLNQGIWTVSGAASGIAFGDTTPGALGVVQLNPNSAGSVGIVTSPLPLGTLDWRLAVRARFPNYRTLTIAAECQIGILNPFVASDINAFRIKRTAAGSVNISAFSGLSGESDTGVAVPVDQYATFEIRRAGAVVTFLINDVPGPTVAYAASVSGAPIWLNSSMANGLSLWADFVKFWAVRQPVSSPTS